MTMRLSRKLLDTTFDLLVAAAIEGRRCPLNDSKEVHGEVKSVAVVALCREGKILVEISGQNFRQVTILTGPHAGKKTAPNPDRTHRVWKTIGTENRLDTSVTRRIERQQPSAPRLLGVEP